MASLLFFCETGTFFLWLPSGWSDSREPAHSEDGPVSAPASGKPQAQAGGGRGQRCPGLWSPQQPSLSPVLGAEPGGRGLAHRGL